MTVMKNGRTTQSTVGMVTDLNVNISVGYDPFLRGSAHGLSSHDFFADIEIESITITARKDLVLQLLGLRKETG